MAILTDGGVESLYHYAPLHYLPFIGRSRALLSKSALRAAGYSDEHLRSTSRRADERRGFVEYVHLTVDSRPKILMSKLAGGFPHVELVVPASWVEHGEFHLCRYNIAKTRYIRRDGKGGVLEGPDNGRYYSGKEVPIAKTAEDCETLFRANYGRNMIEVLVPDRLDLPDTLGIAVFTQSDYGVARRVLDELQLPWQLLGEGEELYTRCDRYGQLVDGFVGRALENPNWQGDGLEFDRV